MSKEKSGTVLAGLERRLTTVSRWFSFCSALALFGMMMLTAVDVGCRFLFSRPLFGAYELIGVLLVVAGPCAMALTQIERKHIAIPMLLDMMPPNVRKYFQSVGLLLDVAIYGMITVGMFILTYKYWERGGEAVSMDLGINLAYPAFVFGVAALLFTVVLVVHLVQSIFALGKGGE